MTVTAVIQSKAIRRTENVARIGEEKCMQGFGAGNLGERDHLEDIVLDGRIILKWNLSK